MCKQLMASSYQTMVLSLWSLLTQQVCKLAVREQITQMHELGSDVLTELRAGPGSWSHLNEMLLVSHKQNV